MRVNEQGRRSVPILIGPWIIASAFWARATPPDRLDTTFPEALDLPEVAEQIAHYTSWTDVTLPQRR